MKLWAIGLAYLAVAALACVGWVTNIYKLVEYWGTESTVMEVMRIIGIVMAPIGIVMGWFC